MLFWYAAISPEGRRVRGSIEAASSDIAAASLRARSMTVVDMAVDASPQGAWAMLQASFVRNEAARAAFYRYASTMLAAGIPLHRTLLSFAGDCGNPTFRETLESVASSIDEGNALSGAMLQHPREFDALSIAMVRAGEATGELDSTLRSLADWQDRDRALKRRVAAALVYPSSIALAAIALLLFLVVEIVPSFAAIFEQLNVALPVGTRLLISVGELMQSPFLWLVMGTIGAVVSYAMSLRRRSDAPWAVALDRAIKRLPGLGKILREASLARFCRTLGSLLKAGVDVPAAIACSVGVVDGPAHRMALQGLDRAIAGGSAISACLAETALFRTGHLQLFRAGVEGGTLDAMLIHAASTLEGDVESGIAALTAAIEPALILFLGAGVATIVASVILPLYSAIGSIR